MNEPKPIESEKRGGSCAPAAYAAIAKRRGFEFWAESVTVLKSTPNGWRVRWETGPHRGRAVNITERNWSIKPNSTAAADLTWTRS
jgi:hypothetical protein